MDVGGASALRRTGPQNRANLAELYQQSDYTAEEYPRTEPKAASDAGASGGKDLEGSRPKAVSSGGSAGVKDKTELKASIRSLKENNEALQDINRTLEQKLFQVGLLAFLIDGYIFVCVYFFGFFVVIFASLHYWVHLYVWLYFA